MKDYILPTTPTLKLILCNQVLIVYFWSTVLAKNLTLHVLALPLENCERGRNHLSRISHVTVFWFENSFNSIMIAIWNTMSKLKNVPQILFFFKSKLITLQGVNNSVSILTLFLLGFWTDVNYCGGGGPFGPQQFKALYSCQNTSKYPKIDLK